MSDLTVFNFSENNIRVSTDENGEPWFVAADVCLALGHSDTSKAVSRLDDDEKGTNIVRTPGGDQEVLVINESGLYSLILTSRKPEAKKFKKWVTSEVLPSIRKTGSYALPKNYSEALKLAYEQSLVIEDQNIIMESREPYQQYVNRGFFTWKPTEVEHGGKYRYTLRVTPRGKVWLSAKYLAWLDRDMGDAA